MTITDAPIEMLTRAARKESLTTAGNRPRSARARQLLEVAAVWGPSFSLDDMAEAIGEPPARLLPSIAELIDAGILAPDAETIGFVGDPVHRSVYDEVPEAVRNALHHQIGALLLARGGSAEIAAEHLVVATRPGNCEALLDLDRATRQLLESSPEAAAQLSLRALAMTEPADKARFARAILAVDALGRAGRSVEAEQLARSTLASAGVPRTHQADLRLRLASLLFMGGRTEDAVAEADAVRARLGLSERLYAEADRAHLLAVIAQGDPDRTRQAAGAVMAGRVGSSGDPALVGSLTAWAFIAWDEGRVADALGFIEAGVHRAMHDPQTLRPAPPRLALAGMLSALGDLDEAESSIDEAVEEIALSGDSRWTAVPAVMRARVRLAMGRVDDAEMEATLGLDACEALGALLFVPLGRAVRAEAALLRGDLRTAAQEIASGTARPAPRAGFGSGSFEWIAARVREALDGPGAAMKELGTVYDEISAYKRLLLEPGASPWLVRTALALDDRIRAEAVVVAAEQLATENRSQVVLAAGARHARGLFDQDAAVLREAAADHLHPWLRASAAEDAGRLLAGDGDVPGASELLEVALHDYETMGADRDAARVRSRLRELGVRRRHWDQAERPVEGWDSLTGTERRVAEIVAEGLTNRQAAERLFLSRHTIDFHLRHVFRKLGIASRAELTLLAIEELFVAS